MPRDELACGSSDAPATATTEKLFAGTSGWAYPSWKPAFFPAKLSSKKFLQYYASRLNAVEVNYSFRHFIGESTLQNWINDTPPAFAFCIKAHQAITHIRRLKDIEEPLRRFLDSVQPLAAAGKLGPVLFQLPPNLKAEVALLEEFLVQLPHPTPAVAPDGNSAGSRFRAAFEFRHTSWFQESVFAALRHHQAALCLAEGDELAVPTVATTDFLYYRFRRSEYAPESRKALAERLRRDVSGSQTVFAFFKHEESPEGALWAEELRTAVR